MLDENWVFRYNYLMMIDKANEMQKVEMVLFGKRALVDADMVSKMERKSALVGEIQSLQKYCDADPVGHAYAKPMLMKKASQLIRLNRTIRKTVQFV